MRLLNRPWAALAMLAIGMLGLLFPPSPLRALLVTGSLLVAPGLAIGRLGGIRDPLVLALVTVPVSLSVIALIATAFVYVGIWSDELVYALVAAVTVGSAAMGDHERVARAALLSFVTIPGLVLLAAQLASLGR